VIATVIICTHNPRADYLQRCLDALCAQTLPRHRWERLVVDNQSQEPLIIDLSWHFSARLVREDELGLTPARLRAIRESAGDILIFVDDDNVLDPNFVEMALGVAQQIPFVGSVDQSSKNHRLSGRGATGEIWSSVNSRGMSGPTFPVCLNPCLAERDSA
jgi:glycosyltransferase involved in cell wall biosynthesis